MPRDIPARNQSKKATRIRVQSQLACGNSAPRQLSAYTVSENITQMRRNKMHQTQYFSYHNSHNLYTIMIIIYAIKKKTERGKNERKLANKKRARKYYNE